MVLSFSALPDLLAHGYDTVIDVRSPAEFAEDHVPGAINLPVLDNQERARVGTIYVQQSPFLARKLGAALVFRNAAAHIEGPLAHHDGGWRPLVYCWRGGQRSGSFGWLLKEIGWRAEVIEGGYMTYRRLVNTALYDTPITQHIVLLDGYTGTAKTDLLHLLAGRGHQVLDLEGLANHRGSLLGDMGGQPSQKGFESAIAQKLASLTPDKPLLIEAESNKVGDRSIPPSLWKAMRNAPRINVTAPIDARARYLAQAYHDVLADGPALLAKLAPLRALRGAAVIDTWADLVAQGDILGLTASLMQDHYDLAYAKSRQKIGAEVLATAHSQTLDAPGLERLADQIEGALSQIRRI